MTSTSAGRKVSDTSKPCWPQRKTEERPHSVVERWLMCAAAGRAAPDICCTIGRSRCMRGLLNNSAPSGRLSQWRKKRSEPFSVRSGNTLRAYTHGVLLPCRITSRISATSCSGRFNNCASARRGFSQCCFSTVTENWLLLSACKRRVSELRSCSQFFNGGTSAGSSCCRCVYIRCSI